MTYRANISAQAQRDLDRIYRNIQAESYDQAANWFNGLHDALGNLSDMPHRNPMTLEDPSLRHLLYGSKPHVYRAIYVIDDEHGIVTLLSIRHGPRSAFQQGNLP